MKPYQYKNTEICQYIVVDILGSDHFKKKKCTYVLTESEQSIHFRCVKYRHDTGGKGALNWKKGIGQFWISILIMHYFNKYIYSQRGGIDQQAQK